MPKKTKVSPQVEAQVQQTLARLHMTPDYMLRNAIISLAYAYAEKATGSQDQAVTTEGAMVFMNTILDTVADMPEHIPACLAHCGGQEAQA